MLDLLFKDHKIRIVGSAKDPLFVARDLAEVLGFSQSNLSTRLASMTQDWGDDIRGDDINLIDAIGRTQSYSTLRAEGMLLLVMRSDKPEAKEFQLWAAKVLKDVLTTGSYEGKPLEEKPIAPKIEPGVYPLRAGTTAEDYDSAEGRVYVMDWAKLGWSYLNANISTATDMKMLLEAMKEVAPKKMMPMLALLERQVQRVLRTGEEGEKSLFEMVGKQNKQG